MTFKKFSARSMLPFIVALLALLLIATHDASAQVGFSRKALVVGVSGYQDNLLPNAGPDAADMNAALLELGFDTIYVREATKSQMLSAIEDFKTSLAQGGQVGLFYFAGHAVHLRGVNYLLPIGVHLTDLSDVPREAVDMQAILQALANAPLSTRIVLIDACRANPFPRSFMSGLPTSQDWVPGLVEPSTPPELSVIGFATSPGLTAEDGKLEHSPYTQAILKYIREPGLPLDEFFQKVRTDVASSTNHRQVPREFNSLKTQFYFRDPVSIDALIADADDDVFLSVNGQEMASWSRDSNRSKRIKLKAGRNDFSIDVYNQHTMTQGIFGVPEGWRYNVQLNLIPQIKTDNDTTARTVVLAGKEDRPVLDGPHHGKRFRVVSGVLFVDPQTAQVSIVSLNTDDSQSPSVK